jgi:SAM-dependent methyltransferase
VPITLWRTEDATGSHSSNSDTGRDSAGRMLIGARLAEAIVDIYAGRRDAVADLTTGHALADACRVLGRRHYPGGFDDDTTLAVCTVSTHGDGTDELRPGGVALAVAELPIAEAATTAYPRVPALFAAAARLLGPGGCLLLVDVGSGAPADWRVLHTAAEHAGLLFQQHIVAGPAGTDGQRFVFYATEADLAALADLAGVAAPCAGEHVMSVRAGQRHARVHRDVIVYGAAHAPDGGDRNA